MVNAEVTSGGELSFDGHIVGRLQGFRFTPETNSGEGRAEVDDAEAVRAIGQEFEVRANRLSEAVDSALVLANDGAIRWLGDPVAKIAAGDKLLTPRALLLADELLTGASQEKAQTRVDLWLAAYVKRLLGPLFELEAGAAPEGAARNVALQLSEALGVLERARVAHDVKALDQTARGMLRKMGVRFGAYYIYIPNLVKPAIRVLATQLWALRQSGSSVGVGLDEISQLAASGRTSFQADSAIPKEIYRVAGFRLCGDRAVRVDIVERLADLIRPAIAYRPSANAGQPPPGSADGDGFVVTGAMTSLTGCSGEQFASVLRSLGFVSQRVKAPALTIAPSPPEIPRIEDGSSPSPGPEAAAVEPLEAPLEAAADGQTENGEASDEREALAAGAPAPDQVEAGLDSQPEPAAAGSEGAVQSEARETQSEAQPTFHESVGESLDTALEAPEAERPATIASDGASHDESAAPVEEVLIEVWRPRPPNRQRNARAGSRDGAPARVPEAAEGDQRSDRRDNRSDRVRHRRHRPPQAPAPQVAEAPAAAESQLQRPAADETNRPRHGRGPRRSFDPANNGEAGATRRGGHNRGKSQDERKQDERRQENAPTPRREAPINLNSPFAKLLALKSQLEAKGKS